MEETPPLVRVEELDWAAVTEEQIKQMDADVVMAAGDKLCTTTLKSR